MLLHLGSAGTSQDVRHVITRCISGLLDGRASSNLQQSVRQLTACRRPVTTVGSFVHGTRTPSGGVCPIQACHSGVFHVLDLVGSSRVGVVCSLSQHAWVWLVRLKSSRLGVVSSRVAFSLGNTTFDFMIRQNERYPHVRSCTRPKSSFHCAPFGRW